MNRDMCRIAVFYDGSYFANVSDYYLYQHRRKARISFEGLHEYIIGEVAHLESVDPRRCRIVDAAYFRGRHIAKDAEEKQRLYSDRAFDDVLIRADISLYQQHLRQKPGGGYKEKQIDVWLALEALEMAILKRYDVFVLIAGDGDFAPLLKKLNTMGCRVLLLGWDFSYQYESGGKPKNHVTRVSEDLIKQANYTIMMSDRIDARDTRDDSAINNLFLSRQPATPATQPAEPEPEPEPERKETLPATKQQAAAPDQARVATGRVNNLAQEQGYGFITPDGGGENIFFHIRDVIDSDELPPAGQEVSFVIGTGKENRPAAKNVRLL